MAHSNVDLHALILSDGTGRIHAHNRCADGWLNEHFVEEAPDKETQADIFLGLLAGLTPVWPATYVERLLEEAAAAGFTTEREESRAPMHPSPFSYEHRN